MSTNPTLVQCSNCHGALNEAHFNEATESMCGGCGSMVQVYAFPALYRSIEGKPAETLLVDAEASCFYHPQKKAVIACGYCGRFLCSLCDVELNGEHLCPKCIESGKQKKKLQNLENRRVMYDDIALSLSILPMLLFYFTIITAPIVLFVSVRYWNAPLSILPRTRIRFVFAILFALLQIAGWAFLAYFLVHSWRRT